MPRTHAVVWLAGMAFGLGVQGPALGWDDPGGWVPDLVVGWTLLSCGLVAARLRPSAWTGGLLLAAGLAWFVADLSWLASDRMATVAGFTLFWHRGPLLQAVLAFPTGRTASRPIAAVVVATYVAAVLQPFSAGESLALIAAALVLTTCVIQYAGASRSRRRIRLFALAAAIAWVAAITSGALVRSAAGSDANDVLLLAYEVVVSAIAVTLTVGLRAAPWEQALVTDLVVELGEARVGDLRRRLADALGDPGLQVGYWAAQTGSYVDEAGQPLGDGDGDGDPARSRTFVTAEGRPLAVLVHDPAVLDDPALVEAVSAATRLVAAHARLRDEVRSRVTDVTTSRRRILHAVDEERGRLEHRVQHSALCRLDELDGLLARARSTSANEETTTRIAAAQTQLALTIDELRRLARGIHPRELSERGLEAALTSLTVELPIPVELTVSPGAASADAQVCAYFVCCEALANVTKYARASFVRVSVRTETGGLRVEVSDDGVGGAVPGRGTGLQGLADRVETLGGTFSVLSSRSGGTRIVATVPVGAATP